MAGNPHPCPLPEGEGEDEQHSRASPALCEPARLRRAGSFGLRQSHCRLLQRHLLPGLLVMCALVRPCRGDTIRLQNGQTLEGILLEETDRYITLNVGVGTLTLQRSRIASVEKSDEQGRERIRQGWADTYFSHARYAPEGVKDLAAAYNELEGARRAALLAHARLTELGQQRAGALDEIRQTRGRLVEAANALAAASAKSDPENYNAVVARHNSLAARVVVLQNSVAKAIEDADRQHKLISGYLDALAVFREAFERRKALPREAAEEQQLASFFANVEARLAACGREIRTVDFACDRDTGHVVLAARINDQTDARLVFDTGATFVSISEGLARRLTLMDASSAEVVVTVADGRKVSAKSVVLDSIQVGDMRAEGVSAVVVPGELGAGVDGLLGMSFLSRFSIRLDPAAGQITMKAFSPR